MRRFDRLTTFTWLLAVAAVIFYSVLLFFYWSLLDWLTPFLAPLLWMPILVLACVAFVFSCILPFRRWKVKGKASLLPLGILCISFIVTCFVDFTAFWLDANFRLKHTGRQEVVRRIAAGELCPNAAHNTSLIVLPRELASTSLGGGEVVVHREGDRLKVLFYTFRGVLDNFAGFIYSSDDSTPKNGDFGGEFIITRKIEGRWYYVSAR